MTTKKKTGITRPRPDGGVKKTGITRPRPHGGVISGMFSNRCNVGMISDTKITVCQSRVFNKLYTRKN